MSAREWPLEGADRTCHTAMHGLQKCILPVQCDSGNGTTEYWYIKHLMFPSLSQAVLVRANGDPKDIFRRINDPCASNA
ncbi:hypothetical protein ACO22_03737 [Paracoccidioides brasiliensis]|uniref:Uncharacterized protein n=1 Tax=Paracoccidioides brasiliensis TaxID=121759 RepID=A0A1D2JF26_PARBR|nr:hypothetical protein ACO22_03737 [Paracoccidioides brasiliensis]